MVVVPERQKESKATKDHGLHATDIRQVVQDGVTFPHDDYLVKISLNGDLRDDIEVFLVGPHRHLLGRKNIPVLQLSDVVQVDELILQE